MSPSLSRALLLIPLCFGSVNMVLATEHPALAQCHPLDQPEERLACYDQLSERLAEPAEQANVTVKAKPQPGVEEGRASTSPVRADNRLELESKTEATSLFDRTWAQRAEDDPYLILPHHYNYILLGRYSSAVNLRPYSPLAEAFGEEAPLEPVEAKYQISLKARLWTNDSRRWGLWFAYTQQSQWQIYNGALSRPFRETNYTPEIIGTYRPGLSVAGFDWNLLAAGYTHQSNGRSDPLSRSWDRVFVEAGVERGDVGLLARAWRRIPESSADDDNPDITDYYGHGQLTAYYRFGGHSLALMTRGNLQTGKGAAQLSWVSPPVLGPLRGYAQLFTGYGESLIDYNWQQNTIGLGVTLNDIF